MRTLALALVVVVAGAAATTVGARSSAFGLAPTKACLAKEGATFQTYPQPLPGLTAGEQSETMIGTLPAGGAPVFFYLVIGRNSTRAQAILTKLRNSMAQAPTKANSTSGTSQNAGNGQTADIVAAPQEALMSRVMFRYTLPVTLRSPTLIAITHTHTDTRDGLVMLVITPSVVASLPAFGRKDVGAAESGAARASQADVQDLRDA